MQTKYKCHFLMFTYDQTEDNLKYFSLLSFILKTLDLISSPKKKLKFILSHLIPSVQNHLKINLSSPPTSFFKQLLYISSAKLLSFIVIAKLTKYYFVQVSIYLFL